MRRFDAMISPVRTAAKYAVLTSIYDIATVVRANGAAIFNVRTEFFVSLSA